MSSIAQGKQAGTPKSAPNPAALSKGSDGEAAEKAFRAICFVALALPLLLLLILLADAVKDGLPRLNWDFVTGYPSRRPAVAGFLPAIMGSLWLMGLTAIIAIPLGLGAAVYLEEYARPSKFTSLIELNISNLAGVPSIIYALLGLELFVRAMGMGRTLIAGACTLALLLLPMVIMASREALRTVPRSIREASYALGGDRWATIRKVILPMSLPGVLTGVILSLARAIGETAPLITIGALTYLAFVPTSPTSPFTAMPIQAFNWISRPQTAFQINAAAGIVVLLGLMLLLNAIAIILRARLQKRINW